MSTKEDYNYRFANEADLEQLHRVRMEAYRQYSIFASEQELAEFEANLANADSLSELLKVAKCFVCEKDNRILGMCFIVPSGEATEFFQADWAHIRLLGVSPGFTGRGIGKKLMELCIQYAKDTGEKVLALHTSDYQNAARHIYEKLGFVWSKALGRRHGMQYFLYTLELGSDEIHYFKAGVNDIEDLVDQRIAFLLELSGPQSPEIMAELRNQLKEYFSVALEDNSCIAYLARQGEEIAGMGAVNIRCQPGGFRNPSGRVALVMSMYTVPAFRRRGVCTGILKALLAESTAMGITAFELHATPAGAMVYTRHGFELHKEPSYRRYIN